MNRAGSHTPKSASRLDGWKDIAAYLGRDQRTAQRWELSDGLPVFREGGKVFAHTADLDRWRASRITAPPALAQPCVDDSDISTRQPRTPSASRFRVLGLTAIAAAAAVAILAAIAWLFWPTEMQLQACRQLTRDGRAKDSATSDGSHIYFNEYVDNKPIVASVPIHGGNVTRLELPLASPRLLALSPVRHSLVLFDTATQQPYELQIGSLTLQQIPLPPGFNADLGIGSAAWDPAGHRLAVSSYDRVTVFEPGSVTHPLQLRFPGPASLAGWDPQGRRLRFDVLDQKHDTYQWWDLEGSQRAPRPLRPFSQNLKEKEGAWTGDGRFFVFAAGDGNQTQIWVEDEQAVPPKSYPLTVDARIWQYPKMVPGRNTVLAIARQAQGQLVTLPVSGQEGGVKPAIPGLSAYELEDSRDGQWIAYTLYPEHTIWRCRVDGSEPRQLTPSGMVAHQPHWSPDGTRIAFMGRRADNRSRVYLVPSSGGALDEPLPNGDDQGVPTWSADGRSLVFGDLTTPAGFDRAAIHFLDLQTSAVSAIAAPIGLWSPRMSPDGKYLAAVSYDNKSLYIRGDAQGSWKRCATMLFVGEPVWSRDSSLIQFIGILHDGDKDVLLRVSPGCEQPRLTVDLSPYRFAGDAWVGIGIDGSPLALLRTPEEIYALDWKLRRRGP
jgi:Tol biopolymer transport system component